MLEIDHGRTALRYPQRVVSIEDIFELRLQGIVVRFDVDWQLGAAVPHGAFLTHKRAGLTLHVRGWHRFGNAEWLREELRSQTWNGPPFDVEERSFDSRRLIGGTFRQLEAEKLVREWFVSDGKRAANASMMFPEGTPRDSLAPFERMLDSIAFVEV